MRAEPDMSESAPGNSGEFNTRQMHAYIEGMREDPTVRDELYKAVESRLMRLSRRMLRDFPRLMAMTEAEDILQGAAMRLLRSLETITPVATREFFRLATVHLRRELIDLTRKNFGPLGQGRHEVPLLSGADSDGDLAPLVSDGSGSHQELEHWAEFHEKIGELTVQEREVFSLVYYHGMKQDQIAGILGMDERTVRRYWSSAISRLKSILSPECLAKLTQSA